MKLSEGATTAAARDVACGMRSSLLFLDLAHPFFPPPRPASFGRARVLPRRRSTWQRILSVRCYYPTCPTSYLRCVRRASSKSPTITRDSTEIENVRISDFHGLPLPLSSSALFDFLRESAFVPLSIFLRCLSLRELFNRFPILYLHFLFLFSFSFFFVAVSSHESKEYHEHEELFGRWFHMIISFQQL